MKSVVFQLLGCRHQPGVRRVAVAVGLTSALALAIVAAAFAATVSREYTGVSFGPSGTGAGAFETAGAVGVDGSSGDVYVADSGNPNNSGSNVVYKFGAGGEPENFAATGSNALGGFTFHSEEAGVSEIAVNPTTHVFYVTDNSPANTIAAFKADGEPADFVATGTNELTGFGEVCGVAVDGNGDIYVGDYGAGVHIFDSEGNLITTLEETELCNVAVDSHGDLYGAVYQGAVSRFVPSSYPVESTTTYTAEPVDPNQTFGIAVDAEDNLYADEADQVAVYSPAGSRIATFANEGEGSVLGSQGVAVTAAAAYVGDGQSKRVKIFGPLKEALPSIRRVQVGAVGFTTASLPIEANPKGSSTSYRIEVGPVPCPSPLCTTAAEGSLGDSTSVQSVVAQLSGLAPGTTYHYRVVVSSAAGSAATGDATFTTWPLSAGGAPSLPDGRGLELVTPGIKNGAEVGVPQFRSRGGSFAQGLVPAAAAVKGEATTFPSFTAFGEGAPSAPPASQYLSVRGEGGWSITNVTPPAQGSNALADPVKGFTPSLGTSVFTTTPQTPPQAPGAVAGFASIYARESGSGAVRPLFTAPPLGVSSREFCVGFEGISADGSKVVFSANGALTPDSPLPPEASTHDLYEWSGAGGLQLLSVLPGTEGAARPAKRTGLASGGSGCETGEAIAAHAISADGSRVVWTDRSEATSRLFDRIDGARTIQLDESRGGSSAGGEGRFWDAATNGSRVFFTDREPLTPDANSGKGFGDLYEFDVDADTLVDLTASAGEAASVLGVIGASEDGSRVYFVAAGVLTGKESNQAGEQAKPGGPNLYVEVGGHPEYIATLLLAGERSYDDRADWSESYKGRLSRVSPDGGHLVFLSHKSLTGFDNRLGDGSAGCQVGNKGEPVGSPSCDEVFLFSLADRSLVCASCSPSGASPAGPPKRQLQSEGSENTVPPWSNPTEQPRYLGNEGRVFFESYDSLSPIDTNGNRDVYEFEPVGEGSCGASSRGFSRAADGCVELISSGDDSDESFFFDASEGAPDVFFSTRQALLPEDVNERYDIYDARIGGGFPTPPGTPPACEGEACRPSSAAPAPLSPGSTSRSREGGKTSGCVDLKRRAEHARAAAKKIDRRARSASDPSRAGRLRRHAHQLRARARGLSGKASRCVRSSR